MAVGNMTSFVYFAATVTDVTATEAVLAMRAWIVIVACRVPLLPATSSAAVSAKDVAARGAAAALRTWNYRHVTSAKGERQ